MALARLQKRVDQLENELLEKDVQTLQTFHDKLHDEKYEKMQSIYSNIGKISNLLDLACTDMNAQSINEMAIAISPLVEQVAPYMDKLDQLKTHAEAGQIAELTKNKDRITQMGQLQKIQLDRAENLGENTTILLAHYNAIIDNLSRDFALLESQIIEVEETKNEA